VDDKIGENKQDKITSREKGEDGGDWSRIWGWRKRRKVCTKDRV